MANGWRASGRSELWDLRGNDSESGWGHRQQATLVRGCVLASLSCVPAAADRPQRQKSTVCARDIQERIPPLRLFPQFVRSLAHLPDLRQCPKRDFDATLTIGFSRSFPAHTGFDVAQVGTGFLRCSSPVFLESYRNQPAPKRLRRWPGAGPVWRPRRWSEEPQE
jgi:hypothetical protein